MTDNVLDVLILEDSLTQALRLQLILESQGYRVTVAGNGMEGLALLENNPFSIVITDWVMPKMDGCEFCHAVRERESSKYVYIILLTTKGSQDDIVAGLEAGADDYLVKPVDESELAARLSTAKRIIELERSLQQRNEEISRLSVTDPLTNVYNRRYLNEYLLKEIARASRSGRSLSIVLCDIDHFKRVNDTYGHLVGDQVLQEFSKNLKKVVRTTDWISRYGGEEFVIVYPEIDLEGAQQAAERCRIAVSEGRVSVGDQEVLITSSFGIVSCVPAGMEMDNEACMDAMISAADECLYQAKHAGRNRSVGRAL